MTRVDGVLLLDKPEGPTSHDVVGFVRWALGCPQVGHCGTLDPLATGLLVVCVGAATRLVAYLTGVDKVYRARFGLGAATTTADREGEVTARREVSAAERRACEDVLKDMCGALSLAPPRYSAVKIDGQAAHARARRGEVVELAPRPMTVHEVREVVVDDGGIEATCAVSKGTYIRSLAEELGRRAGLPAHLAALRRLACGAFTLEHPGARVLSASRLPDRPGTPPKFHLGVPGAEEGRAAARAHLLGGLVAMEDALPFPVTFVAGPPGALEGLLHGQSCAADALPTGLRGGGEGLTEAPRRGVSFAQGPLVIARLDEQAGVWRPERLIPRAAGTSKDA